jgi:hypothetical protein
MKYFKLLKVSSGSEFTHVRIELSPEDLDVKFGLTAAEFNVTLHTETARDMTLEQLQTEALKQIEDFRISATF